MDGGIEFGDLADALGEFFANGGGAVFQERGGDDAGEPLLDFDRSPGGGFDEAGAKFLGGIDRRAEDHQGGGEGDDVAVLAPAMEVRGLIGADEEVELGVGGGLGSAAEGVDPVAGDGRWAGRGTVEFVGPDGSAREAFRGEAEHGETVGIGRGGGGFQWRLSGGYIEEEGVGAGGAGDEMGELDVSAVRRIEGPAIQEDGAGIGRDGERGDGLRGVHGRKKRIAGPRLSPSGPVV
jgi:hypothetical protein